MVKEEKEEESGKGKGRGRKIDKIFSKKG